MKDWKSSSPTEKLKIVMFSLLPVFVLFVIAEFVASASIYRRWGVVEDPRTGASTYRMQIGRFWGTRSVTPLNSNGFPDREYATLEPKGDCMHVVLSGDSFVFGDGVDGDKSFFSLVRDWNDRNSAGRCIRFFNIAERATTIEQQAARIRETQSILQPDLVLLGQYQNDLTDLTKPGFAAYVPSDTPEGNTSWAEVIRRRVPVFRLSLMKFLTYHAFAFMVTNDIEYDALAQWSVLEDPSNQDTFRKLSTIYDSLFLSLAADLERDSVDFGVVIFPSKLDVLAGRYPEEQYFVSLAERAQVPHLSLFPTLDAERSRYVYLMYDGHFNEHGNAIVANELIRWLFTQESPPFAALKGATFRPGSVAPQLGVLPEPGR